MTDDGRVRYENRQPPEGINVSSEHPLRTFAKLAVAAVLLVVAVVAVLQFAGGFAAKRIPFGVERRLVDRIPIDFGDPDASPAMTAYLNGLALRLAATMTVPDGMDVRVHYDPADTFNAFATAGGNLVLYRGLLESMPHENALAMVVAHEIAHVLHRDPIASLGGGVASGVALLLLTGNAGSRAASEVLQDAGLVTGMSFTRRMETDADVEAVRAVGRLYGHVDGASALFELVAAERAEGDAAPGRARTWVERFTGTHPLDADRIAAIDALAAEGGFATDGPVTPLPDGFRRWLRASDR